jgi:hypothetical protein
MPWTTYLARAQAAGGAAWPGRRDRGTGPGLGALGSRRCRRSQRTLHLRTIDAHFYPLDGCRDPAARRPRTLLSRRIQTKLDERVRLARDARAAGLKAVISEANSVSCGGVAGVSDEPAAAVWGGAGP